MKPGTCLQTHVSASLKPGMTGFISTALLICHKDRGSNLRLEANELNMLRENVEKKGHFLCLVPTVTVFH